MHSRDEKQTKGHVVNILHNQDHVFKESFSVFKGGSLDFLDEDLSGEVTDILSTEFTETSTKKSYSDNALKLLGNTGVHTEWEAGISEDDLMRFGEYNLQLSRMHKIPFTTVILTAKKPGVTQYENPSISFKPKVIYLKDRDADSVLSEIEDKIKTGKELEVNELELIYLPLYGSLSGKATPELLETAIKLTSRVVREDNVKRRKLYDLLILLTGSFVSDEELSRILEANMRILEDSTAVRVLEDRGIRKGIQQGIEQGVLQGVQQGFEQTAKNMLKDGDDESKISRITGLAIKRIEELRDEL